MASGESQGTGPTFQDGPPKTSAVPDPVLGARLREFVRQDAIAAQGIDPAPYKHPFNIGYDARVVGLTEYGNPYTNEQWEWNAWQHGWDEADGDVTSDE